MLELTLPSEKTEGHWFDYKTRGETIRIKIRPISVELSGKIEKKHTKHEFVSDPATRKMAKVSVLDSDAALDEKINYVIETFEGVKIVDEATDAVIPNTDLRAKRALLLMKQPEGEQPIFDFVFETSRELTVSFKEEEEVDVKNS